jgi:ABC-type transport system involved in cytochrome c biogenesis permease subunit
MFKLLLLTLTCFSLTNAAADFTMETLPVQNGGRLKPFDTYARETLTLLHGRSRYRPEEGKPSHEATKIVATWMMVPEAWMGKEFVRVDHLGLKKALNLPEDKKFFSPEELLKNTRFGVILGELNSKRQFKEKLNPFDQAVQKLETQMGFFHEVRMGALRVAPSKDPQNTTWLSIAELDDQQKELFFNVLKDYSATFTTATTSPDQVAASLKSVDAFAESVSQNNPSLYPTEAKMNWEVHYNQFSPFLKSSIFYGLAAILMFLAMLFHQRYLSIGAWVSTGIAFLLHTYGFGLRVYLTERPPVSNMFETVIWVAWGTIIFTSWLSFIKKKNYILLSGTLVATLSMIVANSAPAILDASLQPLEPVLRSNLWLIIHVMTITLSYAAFFLALGVGNVALFHIIRGAKVQSVEINDYVDTCYKSLQAGVVLLAAGTILGGVWADYSWGRFWGWDPKETWALIALLGYLALLHGRLAGLVKNFGMLAGSIIAFNLVVMAWYGVNFVLGAGLHTYGFGAGGIEYVAAFVGLQFLYVVYAGLMIKKG